MSAEYFDNEHDVIAAMRASGINYDAPYLEPTGKPLRFGTDGKPRGKDATVFVHDDCQGGFYQNHRAGTGQVNFQIRREFTEQEKRDYAKRKAEQAVISEKALKVATHKAVFLWRKKSQPARPDFPYLVRKGIKAHITRILPAYKNVPERLVIPGYNVQTGELQTIQTITSDNDAPKIFFKGAKKTGAYCPIGKMGDKNILCLVEGFATGASVFESTGLPVAVAFDSGNLKHVSRAFREKFPDLMLIICGDDDADRENTNGNNPGKESAIQAADLVGGYVALPYFGPDRPDHVSDFNDMHRHIGLNNVGEYINRIIRDLTHDR